MKKIKNCLWTSMNQDRFTDLSFIYIERDLSNELSNEKILNKFTISNRRFQLYLIKKYNILHLFT
jgi:hypothetical protein